MAKGVGLDAGIFEVKVVELDGSYRKPRLAKVSIDRVPATATGIDSHEQAEAQAVLQALKDAQIGREDVCLGFPCREAVLRTMKVPFTGADAIRKVLKFEAESEIHSHNVDDMVVDFHILEEGDHQTKVLVAAVPKRSLGSLLQALAGLGVDPEKVDLDIMALFRVATWAGCFGEQAAEEAASEADDSTGSDDGSALPVRSGSELSDQGRTVRLVLDLGARSTRVLAVDNGELVDMRALRVGFESLIDDISSKYQLSADDARRAVEEALQSGADVHIEAGAGTIEDEATIEDGEELILADGDEPLPAKAIAEAVHTTVAYADIEAAREQTLKRIRGELIRFLAGLPQISSVEMAFITGGGISLPGIRRTLRDTFQCRVEQLDVLGNLSHNLPPEEAEVAGSRIAVAVGLALGSMGGLAGFEFRREELSYRRRFDRIKFPLAIACMLALFLPFIYGVRQYKQLGILEQQYGSLFKIEGGEEGGRRAAARRATFWGYVGQVMNKEEGSGSNSLIRLVGAQRFQELTDELVAADTFDRLRIIRNSLKKELRDKQEETGVYEDLQLPSGLYVLSYFAELVESAEMRMAPFLITEIELKLEQDERNRHLTFKVAFRGNDYRQRFAILQDTLRASFEQPGSPFLEFGRGKDEDAFEGGDVQGAFYGVRLNLRADWDPRAER